jgi:hypothetical protein
LPKRRGALRQAGGRCGEDVPEQIGEQSRQDQRCRAEDGEADERAPQRRLDDLQRDIRADEPLGKFRSIVAREESCPFEVARREGAGAADRLRDVLGNARFSGHFVVTRGTGDIPAGAVPNADDPSGGHGRHERVSDPRGGLRQCKNGYRRATLHDRQRHSDAGLPGQRAGVGVRYHRPPGHKGLKLRRLERDRGRKLGAEGPLSIEELSRTEIAQHDDGITPGDKPARLDMKLGEVSVREGGGGRQALKEREQAGELAIDHQRDVAGKLHGLALVARPLGRGMTGEEEGGEGQERDDRRGDQPEQVGLCREPAACGVEAEHGSSAATMSAQSSHCPERIPRAPSAADAGPTRRWT